MPFERLLDLRGDKLVTVNDRRFTVGSRVRTVRPPKGHECTSWVEKVKGRQWNVVGKVVSEHSGEGLCYGVQHDRSGLVSFYEPCELRPVVQGFLLGSFDGGEMHFRVYGPNHKTDHGDFIDYEIHHSDLKVDLVGEFDFYERDGKHILDHSRALLGIKDE